MISIIAALAENRVIGANNALPWRLPNDLRHFRRLTTGHAVVMGRKNYESIGRPLPERTNIVITRDRAYCAPGCRVAHSLDEALALAGNDPEIFVIGGAQVYREALPRADRMYLTLVHAEVPGDTFFPEFDRSEWREVARTPHKADAQNPHAHSFVVLERVGKAERGTRGAE